MSMTTRPSIVKSLLSCVPNALELRWVLRIVVAELYILPRYGKDETCSVSARLRRNGRSKLTMLYPVRTSGSALRKKLALFWKRRKEAEEGSISAQYITID